MWPATRASKRRHAPFATFKWIYEKARARRGGGTLNKFANLSSTPVLTNQRWARFGTDQSRGGLSKSRVTLTPFSLSVQGRHTPLKPPRLLCVTVWECGSIWMEIYNDTSLLSHFFEIKVVLKRGCILMDKKFSPLFKLSWIYLFYFSHFSFVCEIDWFAYDAK